MSTIRLVDSFAAPGRGPAGLTWDGRHLWHADFHAGRLFRLEREGVRVVDSFICPGVLSGLTWDGRHLWQALVDEGWVRAINPTSHDFDRTIVVADAGRLAGVAWDGQQLWAVSQEQGKLLAIDRERGEVTHTLPVPVAGGGLAYRDGAFWLGAPQAMRFDEETRDFTWMGGERCFVLLQIDAASGRERGRQELDFLPLGITWVREELWLAGGGRLHRARVVEGH